MRRRPSLASASRRERSSERTGERIPGMRGQGWHAYPLGMPDKLEILRTVPLFADLDERSLQAVSILAREVTLKAGEVFMTALSGSTAATARSAR